MSSNQSQSRSVISATSQAHGDALLDPIYISDSEDEATPEVTYISSDSEDENGHLSQDAITNEVVHDEVLGENMMQCHSCPICLEIAFQPYIIACGHTFCVHCLNKLRRMCNEKRLPFHCPTCRAKIVHKPILCFSLQAAAEAVGAHQRVSRPAPKKLRW